VLAAELRCRLQVEVEYVHVPGRASSTGGRHEERSGGKRDDDRYDKAPAARPLSAAPPCDPQPLHPPSIALSTIYCEVTVLDVSVALEPAFA
jgi:hypothetical protein